MFVLKNHNDPELNEANFHARLNHWKQLHRNIHPMVLSSFLFTNEQIFTMTTLKKHRMTDCRPTHIHQPRRKTSWQNAWAHNINVQSLMTLVGESQVVDITPVFFLITESMPERSISPNYLVYFSVFVLWCVIILFNVHLFIVKLVKISFLFIICHWFLYCGE